MLELTDQEFQAFVDLFRNDYGINLSKKRVLIEGRLVNTLRERKIASYTDYLTIIKKDTTGTELQNLVNKITTNHTFFMREIEHFNFLKATILPQLERTNKDKVIRIWSAGCSSGEEAYSMAMIIDDYFGARKIDWDTSILATDISQQVLTKARNATYSTESLDSIPEGWRKKYFVDNNDGTCSIKDFLKSEVIFKEFNLMDSIPYRKPFDLISCRNVMIYFESDTKIGLVNRFYNHTNNHGYLYIGHSEAINKSETSYRFIKPAIYQKELLK